MKQGRRLADIPDFPTTVTDALSGFSITTAEELLAHAAFEGDALRSALRLSGTEFSRIVAIARGSVDPQTAARAENLASGDPDEHGMGARDPDEGFPQFGSQDGADG